MNKSNIINSILILVVAFALLISALLKDNSKKIQDQNTNATIQNIQETLSPYVDKDKMQKLVIASNFVNKATLGKTENTVSNKIEKKLIVRGVVTKGYLYIVAKTDNGSLKTKDPNYFDDIYANLVELNSDSTQSKEYGGHLIENRSLSTPKSDLKTELLFSLANVPYLKTYTDPDKEIISGNWLQILNDRTSKKIVAFSSTLKQGEIRELSIYYECLENTDCSIVSQ